MGQGDSHAPSRSPGGGRERPASAAPTAGAFINKIQGVRTVHPTSRAQAGKGRMPRYPAVGAQECQSPRRASGMQFCERERGPGSAAPAGRWVGRGVQPREVGRSRGTEFAKLLTEKQVKMDSVTWMYRRLKMLTCRQNLMMTEGRDRLELK